MKRLNVLNMIGFTKSMVDKSIAIEPEQTTQVVEEKPKKRRVSAGKRLCAYCEEASLARDWLTNGEHCPKCEVRMVSG